MTDLPTIGEATISRRSTVAVTASTLVAGASGYVILLLASNTLAPAGYARFSVFWSLYFALLGVLFGLQQESTRAASAGRVVGGSVPSAPDAEPPVPRVRIVRTCVAIGAVGGAVVAVTAPLWSSAVFAAHDVVLTFVVAVAAVLYAGQTGLLGALGGQRRWGTVATVITAEATVRLVAVAVAAAVGWGLLGMSVATGVAAVAWLGVLAVSRPARTALRTLGDTDTRAFVRRSGHAMLAAAASAALVMGFPVLLEVTTPGELGDAGGRLVLAIILTRAPLLVPMNAFQGVAINHFVTHRRAGPSALARPALTLGGVGVVGAGLAWLAADPVITAIFGDDYHNPPLVLAGLTIAATLVAALTLTGSAVLAADRHRPYVAGWVAASVTTAALLLLPGSLTTRAMVSLVVGPLVGVVVHVVALVRTSRAA